MIKFLEHNRIDKKKWDDCIQRAPNGMVYAASWYLDLVSPGWNALSDGIYETVFPLTWRKKYGFMYLFQPPFTQQLGIFSLKKNISEKTATEFMQEIPDQYRFVEIQVNTKNSFRKNEFNGSERITHLLDLEHSYEKIYSAYSENLKRNIKRAFRSKLELTSDVQPSDVIRLFKNNKGKEVDRFGKKEYTQLLQIIREADRRKLVTILGARTSERKLCAAAVFLESNNEFIFFFSGGDEESRKNGAMSLIIDYFIRSHAGENRYLDFEGSMNKNLARFYKSFGSKEVVYLQIKKNKLPAYIRWIKK